MTRNVSLRAKLKWCAGGCAAGTALLVCAERAAAQSEITPAPAAVGADIPVTYFGPAPSSVEPELIGPRQLLTAGEVDLEHGTVTLPLYRGRMQRSGKAVWYILTDASSEGQAAALGLNFSAKLEFAATCRAARNATYASDGSVEFEQGEVDFSPERSVVPSGGAQPFPPASFAPGSVGDRDYSPLVRLDGVVYNAPIVAFDVDESELDFCDGAPDYSKVHDKVVRLCPRDATVTLGLSTGFSFSRPLVYLSTDSNDPLAAALEAATLAPGLDDVLVGRDDSFGSGVERLFAVTNGPTNLSSDEINPQRQGLDSALVDAASPLNVFGGIPTLATDYSPIWDFNLGEWTQAAIDAGYRSRVTDEFTWLALAQRGFVTGPNGAAYGSSGIVVNCPPVMRLL